MSSKMRGLGVKLLAALAGLAILLVVVLYLLARQAPVVHRADVSVDDWPTGAEPLTILFLSDIQVSKPDMTPVRLETIIEQVNALNPDLILLGGDHVSASKFWWDDVETDVALAPLARLTAPLGVYGVLGNHDHHRDADAIAAALEANGVIVLDNEIRAVGPVLLAGVDDPYTGHARPERIEAEAQEGRPLVLLSHSPDIFPQLRDEVSVAFAGHTHCGQIDLPVIGVTDNISDYGERYTCGRIDEAGATLFVSAGLGTSDLPFRFNAPPDMWLVTLGG